MSEKHLRQVGDVVESRGIGACATFRGEIVACLRGWLGDHYYHVRNERDGSIWHREDKDFVA